MRIVDLLKPEAIVLGAAASDKENAIDTLVSLHKKVGNIEDAARFKEDILKREALGSTAVGEGIAIPHAKSEFVKAAGLSAMTVPSGVDYGAPDGKRPNTERRSYAQLTPDEKDAISHRGRAMEKLEAELPPFLG